MKDALSRLFRHEFDRAIITYKGTDWAVRWYWWTEEATIKIREAARPDGVFHSILVPIPRNISEDFFEILIRQAIESLFVDSQTTASIELEDFLVSGSL